jgi:uncharacterized lipoprotein YmbA
VPAALGILLLLAGAGCIGSTPPSRFFVLTPRPGPALGSDAAAGGVLVVGPVTLPPEIDRPQLVTRIGEHERHVHETARWAAPLDQAVARVLAEDLASRLGTTRVGTVPVRSGTSFDQRVAVDILVFDAVAGGDSVLTARWTAYDAHGNARGESRGTVRAAIGSSRPEDIVDAMSRNLADLADEIAAFLRQPPRGG